MPPLSWILAGVVALAVGGYVWHCEHVKSELAASVAIAQQQQRENAKKAFRDQQKKERTDENYERNVARLAAELKRLRDARPSLLPAARAGSERPELACFDRAELDRALRKYRDGVVGLIGEGAAAVEGLDTARSWVKGRE